MTQNELYTSTISLKIETLDCWTIYFNSRKIGDYTSAVHQRENLKALDLYLTVLDYCYDNWDLLEDLGIEEDSVKSVMEAAISNVRTFKPFYYE
jgi:hypothetical protein